MLKKSADFLTLTKAGVLLCAIGFAYFCFREQYRALFDPCLCTDAYAYTKIGTMYAESGFVLHEWSKLRLYAYPSFIALVNIAAEPLGIEQGLALFVVQLSIYFSAVIILSRNLTIAISPTIGNIIFFALIANVFVYPYLVISLTDGVSVCLLLFIAALIVHMQSGKITAPWMFLLGILVGLGVMVRPANLYWLLIPAAVLGLDAWKEAERRWGRVATFACASGAGFFVAVLPQIILNYQFFGELTFLPVFKLGSVQIGAGITAIKYATNLTGNGPPAMVYPNVWVANALPGLSWYFNNPWLGFRTMFLHIFGALDFDYLFCYIYDLSPKYRPMLFLYSQSVLFWGVVGFIFSVKDMRHWEKSKMGTTNISTSFLILILAPAFGWLAVTSVSQVENRFSLPMVAILLPLAAWVLFARRWQSKKSFVMSGFLFVAYLLFAWWVSSTISSLIAIPR